MKPTPTPACHVQIAIGTTIVGLHQTEQLERQQQYAGEIDEHGERRGWRQPLDRTSHMRA